MFNWCIFTEYDSWLNLFILNHYLGGDKTALMVCDQTIGYLSTLDYSQYKDIFLHFPRMNYRTYGDDYNDEQFNNRLYCIMKTFTNVEMFDMNFESQVPFKYLAKYCPKLKHCCLRGAFMTREALHEAYINFFGFFDDDQVDEQNYDDDEAFITDYMCTNPEKSKAVYKDVLLTLEIIGDRPSFPVFSQLPITVFPNLENFVFEHTPYECILNIMRSSRKSGRPMPEIKWVCIANLLHDKNS